MYRACTFISVDDKKQQYNESKTKSYKCFTMHNSADDQIEEDSKKKEKQPLKRIVEKTRVAGHKL